MEQNLALELHPGGRVLAASIQLTDASAKESFGLGRRLLVSPSLRLLSVFVGGQFDGPLQEACPIGSLDHRRRHFFLFPPQSATDWFI